MVRGCEKRVVRLQNPDSRFFDEVYFMLRDELPHAPFSEADIVAEANRILEENVVLRRGGTFRLERRLRLRYFLFGVAAALAVTLPLAFLR